MSENAVGRPKGSKTRKSNPFNKISRNLLRETILKVKESDGDLNNAVYMLREELAKYHRQVPMQGDAIDVDNPAMAELRQLFSLACAQFRKQIENQVVEMCEKKGLSEDETARKVDENIERLCPTIGGGGRRSRSDLVDIFADIEI